MEQNHIDFSRHSWHGTTNMKLLCKIMHWNILLNTLLCPCYWGYIKNILVYLILPTILNDSDLDTLIQQLCINSLTYTHTNIWVTLSLRKPKNYPCSCIHTSCDVTGERLCYPLATISSITASCAALKDLLLKEYRHKNTDWELKRNKSEFFILKLYINT